MNISMYEEILAHTVSPFSMDNASDVVSRYTPAEIRTTISRLVGEENIAMASALAEAGIALYPKSEDILAMVGLLAMLRGDWEYAVSALNELLEVQADSAPLTTHLMFIRALRCALEPAAALSAVMIAHDKYPNHPDLNKEFDAISKQLGIAAN